MTVQAVLYQIWAETTKTSVPKLQLFFFLHVTFIFISAGEEALCVVCNIVGNIHEQLFCTSCGHHYHGNCLHPPVEVNPIVRAGWQCPDCKICQMCRYVVGKKCESVCEKANSLGSDQVRHKLGCTVTEDG